VKGVGGACWEWGAEIGILEMLTCEWAIKLGQNRAPDCLVTGR